MFVSLALRYLSSSRLKLPAKEEQKVRQSVSSGTPTSFQMRKLKPKFSCATVTYFFDLFPHALSSNNRE